VPMFLLHCKQAVLAPAMATTEATRADGSLPVLSLASCVQDLLSSKSSSGAGQVDDGSQMRDTQV